jgi:hypothetical protein
MVNLKIVMIPLRGDNKLKGGREFGKRYQETQEENEKT